MSKAAGIRFMGVREFKEQLTGVLASEEEVVVTRHGKPIARVVPVPEGSPEDLLLGIGMILGESGITKDEALKVLKRAGKTIYG
ncbi:MAG TPA: type II toxin-antitoxin system prevent-host-death family antitoxin [Candidatus Deferrimicrobiaceae bacterium]|jgi:prevent-host-death family protein